MAEEVTSYALLVGGAPGGPPAIGRLNGVGGETIFPVYSTRAAAEAHGLLMGREHRVVEGSAADLADLIEEFAPDYEFVAVDPPLAMEGEEPQPVRTVPVATFLERLRGQE